MMKNFLDISQTIGNTPLVKLSKLFCDSPVSVYAKLEFFNPMSSVKDRIGLAMIEAAEKDGKIRDGSIIVEPTSGNTGIALAFVCAIKGYKCILTMPASMSMERRALLRSLGAELYLTPAEQGMKGAIAKAEEIEQEMPGSFMPNQFENPANPLVHYQTTGPEIWDALNGQIDIFIAGVGTGGTITGAGKFFKERKNMQIVAIEPDKSAVLSGSEPGSHKIMGIGAGFVPKVLDTSLVDQVIVVNEDKAMAAAREIARIEGIVCGISSGAALVAVKKLVADKANQGKTIVAVFPSSGERYLSTDLFKKYLF